MVITFYTLVMAAFMPIGGKLCDTYGRRNVFRLGSIVYGTGSLITALSLNVWMLMIGRPVEAYVTTNTKAGVTVVSAEDVAGFAQAQGLSADQADLIASLYRDAQLDALRSSLFVVAGLAILAVLLSIGIPGKRRTA